MEIIDKDDPLRTLVEEHERRFPCPDLEKLADEMVSGAFRGHTEVEILANTELQYRTGVVKQHRLSLHQELFYFGRPIFQLLQPLGIKTIEAAEGIQLQWPELS